MREKHDRLREKLWQIEAIPRSCTSTEVERNLRFIGIEVTREANGDTVEFSYNCDPRKAHDQQCADIPTSTSTTENQILTHYSSEMSVTALIDTRAARNQDAFDLASAKFVYRRSSILRRSRPNSIDFLAGAYPDLFGISSLKRVHKPAVGFAEKLRHI